MTSTRIHMLSIQICYRMGDTHNLFQDDVFSNSSTHISHRNGIFQLHECQTVWFLILVQMTPSITGYSRPYTIWRSTKYFSWACGEYVSWQPHWSIHFTTRGSVHPSVFLHCNGPSTNTCPHHPLPRTSGLLRHDSVDSSSVNTGENYRPSQQPPPPKNPPNYTGRLQTRVRKYKWETVLFLLNSAEWLWWRLTPEVFQGVGLSYPDTGLLLGGWSDWPE